MTSRKLQVVGAAAALVLLSTGGAVAAAKIDGANIKNGTVTSTQIKNQTITRDDIAERTIGLLRLREGAIAKLQGATGPAGPIGPQGPQGEPGIDGQDGAVGPQGPQGDPGADGADGADGAPGADGAVGPQGPQGDPGPAGPPGADGQDGASGFGDYGFAGNTASPVIAVVLGGTSVPLPDVQNLSGVVPDGTNTNFTVATTGVYRVSYSVEMTVALLVSSRVSVNGTPSNALTESPALAVSDLDGDAIISLTAGDVLSLELFGLLGAATLNPGVGASLTIQQIG